MSSSPPLRRSKRKKIENAVQKGVKRFKTQLQSFPLGAGSSLAPLPDPTSTAPSQSATPGPSKGTHPTTPTNIVPNSVVTPAPFAAAAKGTKPSATNKRKGAVVTGLESALQALHISAGVIPPLKPAIGGLVSCLDVVQAATINAEEYEGLSSELKLMACTLKEYLDEPHLETSSSPTYARIALSIEAEVAQIKAQQDRRKVKRTLKSAEDRDNIIQHYRRVEGFFRQLLSDISLQTLKSVNRQHVTTLLQGMSPVDDARYNSGYSTTIERRGCTKQTREQVQTDLQDWVQDPSGAKIYWMNGMAGTGKTTIAYSLCEWLAANQRLGASFFCSRISHSCRNVNSIVPTIAHELAVYSAAFRAVLGKILEDDPGVSRLNVAEQFERLVRDPILEAKAAIPEGVVVVIDALDECEDDCGIRLILQVLLQLGTDLPLKFFVTSRPEPTIREKMLSSTEYSPAVLHLHDIEESIVEEDIKKYLAEVFEPMSPSPSNHQIGRLAKLSGKLFIYAATVARYIFPRKAAVDSMGRLASILSMDSQEANRGASNKKYKKLDELYTAILTTALCDEDLEEDDTKAMHLVLCVVVCAKEPMTIPSIALFLSLTEDRVISVLQPLRSVLHLLESTGLVSTFHASFSDYMLHRPRSGDFSCDQARHGRLLAGGCFAVMSKQLRFNICRLKSSFIYDKDVEDLDLRIRTNVSPSLFHACQYWGDYLIIGGTSDSLYEQLVDFLNLRLLFWMEVLNINQCIAKGISALSHAETWLSTIEGSANIWRQATDAKDFVIRFTASACSHSTPHIYISALPFSAKSSWVYTNYLGRTRGPIDPRGTATSRNRVAQASWTTNSSVLSLEISSDGTRIVYGDSRGAIYIRNAHTGNILAGPFHENSGKVYSVLFSPDDMCIVSGTDAQTFQVRDTRTGEVVAGPFQGHTDSAWALAFSPDGTHIVSGSKDLTVRVWDIRTEGAVGRPFKGHTMWVTSVAFSPDREHVVSGSIDKTIRVWNIRTGDLVTAPFQGHTDSIWTVSFSPDGTRIVSGSFDQTIRIWCAHTGDTVVGPLKGHKKSARSVAFSPDGTLLVSGSLDETIRVWNANTGDAMAEPFEAHTDRVNVVTFSPDGTRIISGSDDETIRVWHVHTGMDVPETLRRHTRPIQSVAISADGTLIASGSYDKTIRVWNSSTGDAVAGPFEGHTDWVKSIAFSPDGTRIASGSGDKTLRVWDLRTGNVALNISPDFSDSIESVAFSPDGAYIVSGARDSGFISRMPVGSAVLQRGGILTLVPREIITSYVQKGQRIRLWDAHTGVAKDVSFPGPRSVIQSVALSRDGAYIAASHEDQTLIIWDVRTGDIVAKPSTEHTLHITSLAFSPNGTSIVSGSADRTLRVWDMHGNTIIGPLQGHTDWIKTVAFSPDGTLIASGSDDWSIRVWDARTGDAVLNPFTGHTGSVLTITFTPDSKRIVSGSSDGVIRVWNLLSDSEKFRSNKDGWFTNDEKLLFWVPYDYHSHIPHPSNTLLVDPRGTAFIDYQNLMLGEKWAECYVS